MAQTSGRVACVEVGDDYGFTTIQDPATGEHETFVLWFAPSDVSAFTRIVHSMWVSILKEAFAGNLDVTLVHPADSGLVAGVRLGTIPP